MGIDRTVREQFAGMHLLAVIDHHVASEQDRIFSDGIIGFDDRHHGGFIVLALLDLHGAGLLAENGRLPGAPGFEQFFNPGQTLDDVAGLLSLEHQQCETIPSLHQIAVAHVQDGIRRDHVGTTEAKRHGLGVHLLHLAAAVSGLTVGEQVTVNDALTNGHHRFGGGGDGHGVFSTFDDQAAHRLTLGGLRQLGDTLLLAEDLRGGHHITGLDRLTVLNLKLGVGGPVAGVGDGISTDKNAFQDHQLKPLDRLGTPVRHPFHIHGHLRCGVEGLEHQLGAQQFDTLHGLDQLVVFERQTLGCLQAQVRTIRLFDMSQIGELRLVGNGVFLDRTQQKTSAFWRFNGLDIDHDIGADALGDRFTGVDHHPVAGEALQCFLLRAEMEAAATNDDFAQDVVLLGDGDDSSGLAEDVLNHFGTSFDPLPVGDHQQGDVLVDLMGFLRNPEQGSSLIDLVAVLRGPRLLDGETRSEAHQSSGLGAEAVVIEFSNHLSAADLAAGDCVEAVTGAVLGLEIPDLTGMGGFALEFEVTQGHGRGDDLHLP